MSSVRAVPPVAVAAAAALALTASTAAAAPTAPDGSSGQLRPAERTATAPRGPEGRGLDRVIFDTRAANFPTDWFAPVPGQGWWSDTLSNYDYNANYLTGTTVGGDDHRSYFTFDVASLDRRVVSATLRIYAGDIQGDATEWLLLSDVTTPAEILNRNIGTSAVIYEDLGTGTRYGHYEIAGDREGTWLELELSRQAVRDLNAARGGFFSLGASLTSLSGSHQSEFLFGSTDEDETAALIVETTPSP